MRNAKTSAIGLVLAVGLVVGACGGSGGDTLTIFAASSLTDALGEAAEAFEAEHAGVDVAINFAATSTLLVQLEQGAGADLFASADMRHIELARESGVVADEGVVFARNRLAIIVPDEGGKVDGLDDLAAPGLRLIIGAAQVPFGIYTRAAFDRIAADAAYGPAFVERVRDNVVSEGLNARHAVSTVQLGEADAAIAYSSDAAGRDPGLRAIPLPQAFQEEVLYPIGVVAGSDDAELAEAFVAFLRGDAGVAILMRHGLEVP